MYNTLFNAFFSACLGHWLQIGFSNQSKKKVLAYVVKETKRRSYGYLLNNIIFEEIILTDAGWVWK